ncbi:MAG: hypothetical protein JSS75_12100 [Bacteroidetes bacterium]|nr:hypothetical protein [Bacteroidota bacterium]
MLKNRTLRRASALASLLIGLSLSSGVLAQSSPTSFRAYLASLPAPQTAPNDATLGVLDPNVLDTANDVKRLERQMKQFFQTRRKPPQSALANQAPVQVMKNDTGTRTVNDETALATKKFTNTVQSEPTISNDSLLTLLRQLQALNNEIETSYRALENTFDEQVRAIDEKARQANQSEPCNGSAECIMRHRRNRASGLVEAERWRIGQEASLLSTQMATLAPPFAVADEVIPPEIWRVGDASRRKLIDRFGEHLSELFTLVAERIALNRMHLATCCRLLREAQGK